jgi:hypothetical protein
MNKVLFQPQNIYKDAVGCYGLKRLNKNYFGPLIRVRRSLDNVEMDIYWDSYNNLSIDALNAFIGSSSGYIVYWYGQNENGLHIIQTTTTLQPRIVNNGVIDTLNGQPSIYFAGSQFLTATITSLNPNGISCYVITKRDSGDNNTRGICSIYYYSAQLAIYADFQMTSDSQLRWESGTIDTARSINTIGTIVLSFTLDKIYQITGISNKCWLNGSMFTNSSYTMLASGVFTNLVLEVGRYNIYGNWLGHIAEVIFMPRESNDTERIAIQQNQTNYFKIT